MENEEKYNVDFYEMGKKKAEDGFEDLFQESRRIMKEYGRSAFIEFWNGVKSYTPPFELVDGILSELPRSDESDILDRYSKNR